MTLQPLGRNWVSTPLRWFVAWWCMGCLFCQWCTSLSPRRILLSSSEGFFKPCSLLWPHPPGIIQFLDKCNKILARSLLQVSLQSSTLYSCTGADVFISEQWPMSNPVVDLSKTYLTTFEVVCGSHWTIMFVIWVSLSLKNTRRY